MDDSSSRILNLLNKTYPLKMFTDLQKEAISAKAEIVTIEDGSLVYKEGDEATHLYVIISGQVRLTLPVDEDDLEAGEQTLGDLEPGDIVGLEAIEEESEYLTNVLALGKVKLARVNLEFLDPLFEDNAIPYDALMVLLNSLKLFLKLDLSWRNPEEAVIFIARRHSMFLALKLLVPLTLFLIGMSVLIFFIITALPGMILVGSVAGGVALISGLWAIWNYLDWANDYSIVTNQRALFQERVIALYDSRLENPLDTILATSIDSTQIGRIVGYGDVVMKTYTGTLIFPDLARWEMVRLMIDDRRARAREASVQMEKQTIQTMVKQRLRLVPPAGPRPANQASEEEQQRTLGELLANFFRMRTENAGVITYRTHWFILTRRMIVPVLVFLVIVALPIARWMGALNFLSSTAFWPLLLIILALDGFWLWYRYEDWANDKYIVSDEQIVDVYKKPLGSEEKRVAPLKSIQSVEYERLGIIGLVLNYGTVFIRIGDTRFTFDEIYNPSEVQRDLFRRIAAQANRDRRKESDTERQRILDVLEAYHEVVGKQQFAPKPQPQGSNPQGGAAAPGGPQAGANSG